jgi:hypothetical protein|tara:strand:+ start:918 stop:1193 length:276 start_codon:yes stop_codon:yes gene_type:complete
MKLSREKINQLANCIMDDFDKREELDYIAEITDVRLQVVKVITEVLSVDDEVDSLVKNKLTSLSKDIWEGSNEWEVLYNKYYEEEMNKKRL